MPYHPPTLPSTWIARMFVLFLVLAGGGALGGCATTDDKAVRAGYEALAVNNPAQALELSRVQLQKTPKGPTAAEALYLRGRALEQLPASSPTESAANYASAKAAYTQVLTMDPTKQLRSYAQASLGNVSYFLEDYGSAATAFRAAYDDLDTDDARAWTLYRTGMSYERLGQFETADHYFAETQRLYPGTLQAKRAAENAGTRAFYVQVGAYSTAAKAQSGVATLRRKGLLNMKIFRDAKGTYLIRIGPYGSYLSAREARRQILTRTPDAMIVP